MPALPAAGVGSGQCVSVGEPESLASGFLPGIPSGTVANVCNGPRPGKPGPSGVQRLAQERAAAGEGGAGTGRGVLATYLRDRRNVHSLAQPTGETRGVGGSGPPPSWPQGSALPAGLSLRQLPSPERLAQGREERLATASSGTSPRGDPCDEHPSSRGSTSGGCSGIVGSQQGPAWHSLDFTRRWCCSIEKGDGPPSPGAVLYHLAEVSDAPDLEGA